MTERELLKKILYMTIAACIVVPAVLFLAAGNYFYDLTINAVNTQNSMVNLFAEIPADITHKEWSVESYDKLKLHADAYLQKKSNRWVVAVHGYSNDSAQMTEYIQNFLDCGFNVLAPDCRGHGKSEGDYIGMGWDDRYDVIAWVNRLIGDYPDSEIVLMGISMGATAVLNASGESLPKNVKCIVEDCGFSSLEGLVEFQLETKYHFPKFPVVGAASAVCRLRAGYWFGDADTIAQVKKSKTPTLFIHGNRDDLIPASMADALYEAAACEKEEMIVPGAEHADASEHEPADYWNGVLTFIERYMPAPGETARA